MSSCAAAISAAAFGPAAAASFDQPPVSRMLTKVSWACGEFSATSRNSGASWVQATVIGEPLASACLKRSSSRPQSWFACVMSAAQPRAIAAESSGMVFSQLQIRRRDADALILDTLNSVHQTDGCFVPRFCGNRSGKYLQATMVARAAGLRGIPYTRGLPDIQGFVLRDRSSRGYGTDARPAARLYFGRAARTRRCICAWLRHCGRGGRRNAGMG